MYRKSLAPACVFVLRASFLLVLAWARGGIVRVQAKSRSKPSIFARRGPLRDGKAIHTPREKAENTPSVNQGRRQNNACCCSFSPCEQFFFFFCGVVDHDERLSSVPPRGEQAKIVCPRYTEAWSVTTPPHSHAIGTQKIAEKWNRCRGRLDATSLLLARSSFRLAFRKFFLPAATLAVLDPQGGGEQGKGQANVKKNESTLGVAQEKRHKPWWLLGGVKKRRSAKKQAALCGNGGGPHSKANYAETFAFQKQYCWVVGGATSKARVKG